MAPSSRARLAAFFRSGWTTIVHVVRQRVGRDPRTPRPAKRMASAGISNRPVDEELDRQARVPPEQTRMGEAVPPLPPRPGAHPAPRNPSHHGPPDSESE